jgi:hypothetical protein
MVANDQEKDILREATTRYLHDPEFHARVHVAVQTVEVTTRGNARTQLKEAAAVALVLAERKFENGVLTHG